jgi:hypothetical protein
VEKVKTSKAEAKLQEYVCIQLNSADYYLLKKLLENTSKSRYWIETPNVLFANSEEVSSLLDFYNNRATSFANLFVASIFGIVTLSAIIDSVIVHDFGRAAFSMVPFWLFVSAGAYTLYRYSFYAGIAEEIKRQGFPQERLRTNNSAESEHCFRSTSLACYVEREKPSKLADISKKIRLNGSLLPVIYALAITALFIFVYWNFFPELVNYFLAFFNIAKNNRFLFY